MRTLVDTDIWSEIFKGKNPTVLSRAAAYLSQHGRYTLTAVTVFEVIQGLQQVQRESRIEAFREMLEDIEILELDQASADPRPSSTASSNEPAAGSTLATPRTPPSPFATVSASRPETFGITPESRSWATRSSFRIGAIRPREPLAGNPTTYPPANVVEADFKALLAPSATWVRARASQARASWRARTRGCA